jgi:hypothetical protein
MSNKYWFLARYYAKNLFLMKICGRLYGFFVERTRDRWEKLHESIKGHDTWLVVGNGPSLQLTDLEAFYKLGIPSIASNKINLLFNRTEWRPKLCTVADPILLMKLPAEHYKNISLTLLPHTHVLMARTKNKLAWRHILDPQGEQEYSGTGKAVAPLNGLFVGGTITCSNIQLAMWAGAKTIYVIGCDHFYANEHSTDASKKSGHAGASNHFDPNYRKPGEIVNEAAVDIMNYNYAVVRKIADQRGVRIVNITRRTALEAFERDTVENALASISETKGQPVQG